MQTKFNNLQLCFFQSRNHIEMPPKKDSKKAEKKEGGEKASTEKPKAEGEPKGKKSGKGKKEKK